MFPRFLFILFHDLEQGQTFYYRSFSPEVCTSSEYQPGTTLVTGTIQKFELLQVKYLMILVIYGC